jgi:ComF family protein
VIAQTQREPLALVKGFGNAVLDLLFPPRCVACHRLGAWFCASCADLVETIGPPVCYRCGLPLDGPMPHSSPPPAPTCWQCLRWPPHLDGLRSCAFHSSPLREAIHDFKYEDMRVLAAPLGDLMVEGWLSPGIGIARMDVIVPVPLHPSRERKRGYNQAVLLARRMGTRLDLPVADRVLKRTKRTRPQVGLGIQERKSNVENAFQCAEPSLKGKRVLLVDDVCTSGSTLVAACRALRDGGASSVWAYTLARARSRAGSDP